MGKSLLILVLLFFAFEKTLTAASFGSDTHRHFPGRTINETGHLSVEVSSDFNSRYVSRELPFSVGPVWQPQATIELYSFGLNVWSNFVLYDEPNQGQFNEVDFIPYYTAHLGNLIIHPYFMFKVFPNGDKASLNYTPATNIEGDIYIQYTLWKFDLFGRMRACIKEVAGRIYANIGAGLNHHFQKNLAIKTSILLNMGNQEYLSAQYGALVDTNIDAVAFMFGIPYEPVRGFRFTPSVNLAVHVVPEIRRLIDNSPNLENHLFWGGINFSYDF